VHRDLKPENALITKDGRVKVADFGIAKAAESGQQGLTSEGMTVGTPEYMSPEQAMAKNIGPQSDLYSIGCMTYEMLTGRLPFTEGSQVALLMRHVNDPVPDVREVDPLIPESVAEWVATATAKDPDERFADASAAWEAFEEAVLEFVGPLWRRDATLEPASEIDLEDIPPQGPTPLRPAARSGPLAGGRGATGFQTYHAPAALHEQLASEGVEVAPALTTPPPAPAAAPRRVTPAPVATAPAPVARAVKPITVEPGAAPSAAPAGEPERAVPVGVIAAGAVVAAIVAFVVGMSGGGGSSVASATGDGFVLKAPSGWKSVEPAALASLDSKAVALAPAGAAAGEGVAAGRAPTSRALALAGGAGEFSRVKLGAGEAASYSGPRGTVYVLPTGSDALVVSCSAAAPVKDACADVAGSVELTRGTVQAPGPTDEGARAVSGALTRLRDAVRNPTEDLRGADARGDQALAATDLSRAYRAAAAELRRASVGALAVGARNDLASALRGVADAWASFARGARSGNVSAAQADVRRARARVRSARAALGAAGYPEQGG
jgi:hypothetical protein